MTIQALFNKLSGRDFWQKLVQNAAVKNDLDILEIIQHHKAETDGHGDPRDPSH